jgi:OmcA/MtrC family decaheme c-type cytochrome
VGTATAETPYAAISSGNNCLRCHDDLYFHGGGRRGFDACISCHGTSGFEDRPRYVAPNAPETAATPVSYRTMLHKIHRGKELPDAATYAVVGFGSGAYPNNYGVSMYDHVGFPAMPDGAKDCAVCHGAGTTNWQSPPERNHPAGQALATRSWRATCGACHASSAALAHMDVNTSPSTGAEACAVCHGIGKEWPVELKHKVR